MAQPHRAMGGITNIPNLTKPDARTPTNTRHPDRRRFSAGGKDPLLPLPLPLPFPRTTTNVGAPSMAQQYRAMGGITNSPHPTNQLHPKNPPR